MTNINAYIGFNGKCRQAMEFYKDCLGGDLMLQTMGESPIADKFPAEMHGKILHAALTTGPLTLMGSDMVGPDGSIKGNIISLSLDCGSKAELHGLYNKFSEGGRILDPLKVQFWGALFGVVTDKFDITWMLHYDKDQQAGK